MLSCQKITRYKFFTPVVFYFPSFSCLNFIKKKKKGGGGGLLLIYAITDMKTRKCGLCNFANMSLTL